MYRSRFESLQQFQAFFTTGFRQNPLQDDTGIYDQAS
jgi:hypothetical protein